MFAHFFRALNNPIIRDFRRAGRVPRAVVVVSSSSHRTRSWKYHFLTSCRVPRDNGCLLTMRRNNRGMLRCKTTWRRSPTISNSRGVNKLIKNRMLRTDNREDGCHRVVGRLRFEGLERWRCRHRQRRKNSTTRQWETAWFRTRVSNEPNRKNFVYVDRVSFTRELIFKFIQGRASLTFTHRTDCK